MKNKSTLARLLAEENIFVIHRQMETAYFDTKKRELGLPIWKDEEMTKNIHDLMVCHEIGHALWTPLDMLEAAAVRKINHSFVNILEDVRIEKKVKSKYLGSVGVFNRGYADLIKKDFFSTAKKNIDSFNLIDRINIFFKSGDTEIPFSDKEKVWVERTASTETPDDVLDLAEELYAWMEENSEFNESGETDGSGETGETGETGEGFNSGKEEKVDDKDYNFGNDDSDSGSGAYDDLARDRHNVAGKVDDNDKNADDSGSNMAGGDDSDCDSNVNSIDDDNDTLKGSDEGGKNSSGKGSVPEATTDDAFSKSMDELRDKLAEDQIYAKIPKVDLNKVIVSPKTLLEEFVPHYLKEKKKVGSDYWDMILEALETLKKDSKKTVSYMVKEFEMKKAADQYARAAVSKTGSLDMGRLHTYKYNEDLFKKITTLPGATNHGMVMVLDWSGSMYSNLKDTLAQLYNLIWFCRQTRIPFEVFAFSDGFARTLGRAHSQYSRGHRAFLDNTLNDFKVGDLALNEFNLLNFFSSKMSVSEEMTMMHILSMYATGRIELGTKFAWGYQNPQKLGLGGTPLNDAIIAMMELVPKFKKETGVQKVNTVFLTDGASNHLPGVYDYYFDKDKNIHTEIVERGGGAFCAPKIILSDPVMNKTYEVKMSDCTNNLLQILKARVPEMNVIGFFIAGSGRGGKVTRNTLTYLMRNEKRDVIMERLKFLNKNNYLALNQLGYDEYYILPGGGALKVENETLNDELVGASKAKLKTAFGKMSKGKISSRQLLNKFVKLVA